MLERLIKNAAFRLMGAKDRFRRIYRLNQWGCDETRSGPGSTMEATKIVRKYLPSLVSKYNISSICDAGCGDFNWIKEFLYSPEGNSLQYFGIDIVPDVIKRNKELYATQNINFLVGDARHSPLPCCQLIICLDVFIHLSYKDIFKCIRNFRESGAVYLLTTSHKDLDYNRDIVTGRWRFIDFALPPFHFPSALEEIDDIGPRGKQYCLWSLNMLPK